MNHQTIHNEALAVAARYKKCEIELIEILEKVWIHRTFHHYDCGSLFEYAMKHLHLSEAYIVESPDIFNMKQSI